MLRSLRRRLADWLWVVAAGCPAVMQTQPAPELGAQQLGPTCPMPPFSGCVTLKCHLDLLNGALAVEWGEYLSHEITVVFSIFEHEL